MELADLVLFRNNVEKPENNLPKMKNSKEMRWKYKLEEREGY